MDIELLKRKSTGWQAPNSMKGIFDLLAQNKLIGAALRNRLRDMVIVRNILVHDYTRIDHRKAYLAIKGSLKIMPQFCLILVKGGKKRV